MFRKTARLFLLTGILLLLTACASPGQGNETPVGSTNKTPTDTLPVGNTSGQASPIPPDTQFSHMLSLVPYSFLEKHDAWFGDPQKAKELYGIQDANSLEALMKLSTDERKQVDLALQGIAGMFSTGNWQKLAPITGYDVWSVDRSIFVNEPPPWVFYVSEGSFNKDIIIEKLTNLGYQKIDYGSYSYYSLNDDFSPGSLSNPVSQQVLAAMNRVAVLDNRVIIAPATDILTGILDAMVGKSTSISGSPAGQALAASLGDVLSGVIMNPERTLNLNPPQTRPPFQFTVPADWGLLHQYEMTGIGFKNDGKDRYWVVSLYYKDAGDAAADAGTLVKRMKSYILNTEFEQTAGQRFNPTPLTDKFEVGQPLVQQYPGGTNPAATLTVECRYKPGTASGYWLMPITYFRDFLFLAPDTSDY